MNLASYIRHFPGYPRPDIVFHDISPLLASPEAFQHAIDLLAKGVAPMRPQLIAGIEARGFPFAGALAMQLGLGMVMVRKKGKLPGKTVSASYALEYGEAILEMQADAIVPGTRVAIIDDLLATGGTFRAAAHIIEEIGGELCGAACVIELPQLNARQDLSMEMFSLIQIMGE